MLGALLLINQIIELTQASFSIRDSVLGRVLFTLTGFHGLHVLVGAILLVIRGRRACLLHYSPLRHTSYEVSI